ncbi:MAG TPA: hypothetical protein VFJ16_25985 [Longimicrobium sp.]|nr:hypothetical protein [Longimicrobium sp.]
MIGRRTAAAAAGAFLLLAACEHPNAFAPARGPSLAEHAAAALGAPATDVQRASSMLGARVAGWDQPQALGGAPEGVQARPLVDAAALAVTPETLPAVARALDQRLRATAPGQPVPR